MSDKESLVRPRWGFDELNYVRTISPGIPILPSICQASALDGSDEYADTHTLDWCAPRLDGVDLQSKSHT